MGNGTVYAALDWVHVRFGELPWMQYSRMRAAIIGIAEHSITDIPTLLIALTTIVLLWKFKKLPEPIVVIAAAVMGLIIYPLLHSHS